MRRRRKGGSCEEEGHVLRDGWFKRAELARALALALATTLALGAPKAHAGIDLDLVAPPSVVMTPRRSATAGNNTSRYASV
jgi:hypothetical protein